MNLEICKLIALVCVGIGSIVISLLPLKIRKISKFIIKHKDHVTSGLHFFGGGLLLGTVLILILPEIEGGLTLNKDKSIPLAELLLSAGFFITYLIEELVAYFAPKPNHLAVFSQDDEHEDENENVADVKQHDTSSNVQSPDQSGIDTVDPSRFDELSLNAITSSPEDQPAENSFTSFNPKYAGSLNTSTQSMFPNYRPNVEASKIQRSTNRSMFSLPKINIKKPNFKQDKTDNSEKSITISRFELIAITLLSFHALVEGLIIGLATSQINLWQLFAVLVIHHSIMAFHLGVELSDGKSSKIMKYLYSIGFAISISVGIAVGIGITSTASQDLSTSLNILIVKGVCSGALLYVVIFEVIHQEKSKENVSGLLQFGAILFGFVITVLIKILSGDPQIVEESQIEESVTELVPPLVVG